MKVTEVKLDDTNKVNVCVLPVNDRFRTVSIWVSVLVEAIKLCTRESLSVTKQLMDTSRMARTLTPKSVKRT